MQNPAAAIRPSRALGTTNNKKERAKTKNSMKKQNNTSCAGKNNPGNKNRPLTDHVNYRSADGLVEVVTKIGGANRFPKHSYPVVCMHLRPKRGYRVQPLNDGWGGLDLVLRHSEVVALLKALNLADTASGYSWKEIPEKSAERKAYWDAINKRRRNACG
jgi:hypothetical protein